MSWIIPKKYEFENQFYEISQLEEKKWWWEENLCKLWDTIKQMTISIVEVTEE